MTEEPAAGSTLAAETRHPWMAGGGLPDAAIQADVYVAGLFHGGLGWGRAFEEEGPTVDRGIGA